MSPKECIDFIASHFKTPAEEDLSRFFPLLENQNLKECFYAILYDYYSKSNKFFFSFLHFWSRLSYNEWLEIFHSLVKNIRTHPSSLDNLIVITYRFIGIDLIHEFSELKTIDDGVKLLWLRSYAEAPGMFFIADEEIKNFLKRNNQDEQILLELRLKFLNEGAKRATPIEPLFHRGEARGIKIFWVQGPIPDGWTWAKKFNLHLLDSNADNT